VPWEWGDPGGVSVSEQPELADSRKGKAVGRGRRKEEAVSFFNPGMTNRAAALDAPDGVLTSFGSSRRTNDAGRDPVGIMRLDGRVRRGSFMMLRLLFDAVSLMIKRSSQMTRRRTSRIRNADPKTQHARWPPPFD